MKETRVRRGKVIEIPEQWRGVVTSDQTKNKRRELARLKRETAPHHKATRTELDERRRHDGHH